MPKTLRLALLGLTALVLFSALLRTSHMSRAQSPGVGTLAVVTNDGQSQMLYRVDTDGNNFKALGYHIDAGLIAPIAWSPDGQQLAFIDGTTHKFTITDLDGGQPRTFNIPIYSWAFAWAPDGQHITYIYDGTAIQNYDLATGQTTPLATIHEHGAYLIAMSWSPDGKHLFFIAEPKSTDELHIIDADGRNEQTLMTGFMHAAAWSADSQRIYYLGQLNGRFGLLSVELTGDASGQNKIHLVSELGNYTGLAFASAADNRQFAFAHGNRSNEGNKIDVIGADASHPIAISLPGIAPAVDIVGLAWRPGTGLGGLPSLTNAATVAATTAVIGLPTPGGNKTQILAAIGGSLSKADTAFYAPVSDVQSLKTGLDTALANYTAALNIIAANKDLPDFSNEPDKSKFLTLKFRALAGKARTEVRQSFTYARTAYLEYVSVATTAPPPQQFAEADTQAIRADLEAAATLGATFATPPKELGWVYYAWALIQYPLSETTYGLDIGIKDATTDDQLAAYQHYLKAGELIRATGPELAVQEIYYVLAETAYRFAQIANNDPNRVFEGLTALQWWKTQIGYAAISEGLQSNANGCGANYGYGARDFSQGIENGVFQDPDGKTLLDWLQEQVKYCNVTGSFASIGYIYQAVAQARLAWLTRDVTLAKTIVTQSESVGFITSATKFFGGQSTDAVYVLHNFGKMYLLTGQPLQALNLLSAVKEAWTKYPRMSFSAFDGANVVSIGDFSKVQIGYDNEWLIGRALIQLGRYREAIPQLQGLDTLVYKYPTNQIYPESQEDLAQAFLGLNRYEEAIVPLENARSAFAQRLTAALDRKDANAIRLARIGLIDAILRLSTPLAVLGRTEEAVTTLQQALDEANKQDDPALKVNTTLRVGDIYLQLQKEDDALRNYQAAADLATSAKLPQQQGRALLGVGQILTKRGQIDDARKAINQANIAAKAANDSNSQVQALDALGDLALLGKPDVKAAQTFYNQALTVAVASKDPRLPIQPLTSLGDVQASSTPTTAQFTYYKALSAAQQIDDREAQARLFARIGALAAAQGDTFNADSAYQNAIQVIEQTQRGFKSETLTGQFAANYAPVYASYLKLLVDQKRYADAFALSEQARARAFLDQLAVGPVDYRQGASADLLQQANDLRTQIDALRQLQIQTVADTEAAPDAHKVALGQVQSNLRDAERKYSDVFTRLQASAPQLSSLTTVQTLPLAQVQAALGSDTTLLSYYTLDSTTYAFVITHDTLTVVTLPVGQAQLTQSVKLFRSDEKQVQGLSDLSSGILTPVISQLKTARVIVVPHNVLNYIPFAALPTAATAGSPLFGAQFVVSYLPSASSLAYLSKTPDQPGALFALGNPAANGQPPLQFAEDEVKQAVAIAGGEAVTGKDATVALIQQKAGDAGTLYIAAHGTFNGLNPLFSALHLTTTANDSGLLEAYKIYSLDLTHKTQLVVLSACDTAVGTLSAGDEFTGLNRAFLYAGAPAVIATLWSVDDKATGLLMKTFFEMRAKGQPISQALQSAQAFMQTYQENGQTPYASPYYWAAFIVTGAATS